MKRFIAVFGVIVIITMHCLSFYPAKAAITGVDYGEMLNTYLGAAETALAASQGITIDWSNLELPAGSDTWTDKQKAQYVVQYVGALKKVGQHAIYDWLFGEDNDTFDIVSANTAAIGLAKNSNINTQDIKAQLDNILATQSQAHVFQRYTDKVIARWNEYNTNYINDYLDQMDTSETITYPDNISRINIGTFIANNLTGGQTTVSAIGYYENGFSYKPSFGDGSQTVFTGLKYPFIYRCLVESAWTYYDVVGYQVQGINKNQQYNYCFIPCDSLNPTIVSSYPIFYDLNSALNYSRTGSVISGGNIGFTLPDAVIDENSDDGKIVAHPIYYPDVMNTDKAIDIDLDKVVDAIASRITAGDTDINFDDLVDAGAAVKIDGTTLTDADTIVKDVSVPIARAKVDTINGVVPTIDVVPPLPPLPPLTPGDYSGEGFNGMSVLARIINATVQGLPEPLILTFFGVVFGAVILGIIKILHH